jgi:hypothetical protein
LARDDQQDDEAIPTSPTATATLEKAEGNEALIDALEKRILKLEKRPPQ